MNKQITILMLSALLCGSQAHATLKVANGATKVIMFGFQNPFTSLIIAGVGTGLVYHKVPQELARGLWNMTKSQARIQSEATKFAAQVNGRYSAGFALTSIPTEVARVEAAKIFAYNFQQLALTKTNFAEKFYSKVIAFCDKLQQYPVAFVVTQARMDRTMAQFYANRTRDTAQKNELNAIISNLSTLLAYLETSATYLQEKSNISSEEQRSIAVRCFLPLAIGTLGFAAFYTFVKEAEVREADASEYSFVRRFMKHIEKEEAAAEAAKSAAAHAARENV
jgi:hypothetical protein